MNATSSALGTIEYSPASGTVFGAGNCQTLTPTLAALVNYNVGTETVKAAWEIGLISVLRARNVLQFVAR